ncbi:cupin domain-containing protein [Rosenbergiella epipactidis]|uniref:cupin domain-containing protein n=1 Tax=Rosenbergiella epipactidis TaxID=1544694 RepID=UPI001F4DA00F|nr:cupin domain-containing protein [Rosenbergiella epipactidis]
MKMTSPSQFSRRNFCQLLLAASAMPLSSYAQSPSASPHVAIQPLSLTKVVNGVPNDKLPLLIYQQAVPASASNTDEYLSDLFAKNGWPVQWRYQIFPFTHYHSNTHELLGVSQGSAKVQLGGETGPTVTVKQGDVILIPAGVGHKQLSASEDFQVLGAYPQGLSPDLYHDDPSKLAEAQRHIANIAMPTTDPVTGKQGGILTLWKA